MSEINERAVVIFLLKKMGFKSVDERNYKRPYYQLSGGKVILFATKSEPGFFFFPFSDISHAFMVVEAMHKEDWFLHLMSSPYSRTSASFKRLQAAPNPEKAIVDGENTTPKAISLAAARALATDKQMKGWGL